jgi:hypothetical protein
MSLLCRGVCLRIAFDATQHQRSVDDVPSVRVAAGDFLANPARFVSFRRRPAASCRRSSPDPGKEQPNYAVQMSCAAPRAR